MANKPAGDSGSMAPRALLEVVVRQLVRGEVLRFMLQTMCADSPELKPQCSLTRSANALWIARLRYQLMNPLSIAISTILVATPAQAEIAKAWCSLTWRDGRHQTEQGPCDFRQAFGNVQVWMDSRWTFNFPAEGQGRFYTRRNKKDFIRFERGGYILTVFQGSQPQNAPSD